MTPIVEKAAQRLEQEEELNVIIVLPSLLSPLPRSGLASALQGCARVLIVEEGPSEYGIGAEISAGLHESGYIGRIKRIGAPSYPVLSARSLESELLPGEDRVIGAALGLL
jgi:2-oxoisovalerate dehydrogenase E1 component